MTWSPERDAQLTALWMQTTPELSAAEIGRVMRLNKNQIVGRKHRLGLPNRETPIRPPAATTSGGGAGHAPARACHHAARRSEAAPTSPPDSRARPGGASPPVPSPLPGRVLAVASRAPFPARATSFARACQFPLWGKERPPSPPLFCGKETIAGSSYCADCHAVTHTTPTAWVRGNADVLARAGRAA
jgi:hypothetical protein